MAESYLFLAQTAERAHLTHVSHLRYLAAMTTSGGYPAAESASSLESTAEVPPRGKTGIEARCTVMVISCAHHHTLFCGVASVRSDVSGPLAIVPWVASKHPRVS